jgi:serine/threonine protein kinase/formylglycine-generating enzyme required for sulfatase activity/Flp pilus assembly protein TadD
MGGPVKDRWIDATLGNGRYKITRKLGEGGMGSVYVAWDANLQTEVVVKVPHATHQDDPEATARFVREASSLVKLSHPHIVKIVDFGEQAGQPYAVMQFLSGGSLATRQGDEGQPPEKLPAESLKDWLPNIAKALDFVHAQGYLHRDVKPPNILFDPYGNAFLSDFGITKFAVAQQAAGSGKSLTGAGMVLGTPEYMAPEVILGQTADGRLDQYGLAVTVYEVLAGRRPFEDATATAVLVQHTAQQPPDVRSFNGDVSPALAAVIRQALAKEPANRFANCVVFADAAIAAVSARSSAQSERPKLKCPACSKTLKIESKLQGKTVPCPACQTPLKVSDDLRRVTLAGEEAQVDRMRGGTRAVVAGDLLKRPGQDAPDEIPVEMPEQPTSHPDDFWDTDGELAPAEGSLPTQSFAAAGIPTQSSRMPPRKRTSAQSQPAPRGIAPSANRTKLLVASVAGAVLCSLGVAIYVVTAAVSSARREDKTAILPDAAQAANVPAPRLPQSQRGNSRAQSNRTARVDSPSSVVATPLPSPAIYDITVSPTTAQLSVENPAVEITAVESHRRLKVSDPQAIPSLTLKLAADGYESRQRELTPRPGLNIAFSLSLNRSQPKVIDRPAGIGSKPKSQELLEGTVAARTEAPDAFDGDRPNKVRENNGLKMMLVWIPPGHFVMGTPIEQGKRQNEGPVDVTLTHGFWLGKYEVTQSEWQSVMHTRPWHGHLYVEEAENDAASYINWVDATAFCTELTKQEHAAGRMPANWTYALPTEAQWEYACRAGTTTQYNFGKAYSQLPENGWFVRNASSRREEYAHRVGSMNENKWGIHDAHGNVSEWCRDLYTPELPGGTDPEVVADGSQRVLRGGGWRSNYDDCRSASRNRAEPTAQSAVYGFRIAAVRGADLQLALKAVPTPESPKTQETHKGHEAVNELVLQSHELIKSLNFKAATKTLERASSMDQTSIVADCTLGLLFSISSPDNRSPKQAEKHFRVALRRCPDDVATLNNLALAEIHLHKYADAVRHLKEASKKSPDSEEVLQNVGRFVSQARSGKLRPSTTLLGEATGIHAKLAAASPRGQANRSTGWLYIPIKDQPTLPLGGANVYEDDCCIVCNGRARVRCPHCSGGSVSDDVMQSGVTRTPLGNFSYTDIIAVQRQCTVCRGTGYVHCPYCSNGQDQGGR